MAVLGRKPAVTQQRDPIVVSVGMTEPPLFDLVLRDDGTAFDETEYESAVVTFSMRPLLSRVPIIENAAAETIIPPLGDDGYNVKYEWQPSDVALEGYYMGWWAVDIEEFSVAYQESGEFPIIISDHGPGLGVNTGAVVDGVGQFMPVTFEAMRHDPNFGDRYIQRFADRAKRETMGTVVAPDDEILYDPQLVDYLSKLTAKYLIAPAKDFWGRTWKTRTTQSPMSVESYPDMLQALDQLHARICRELPEDLRQVRYYVQGLPVAKVLVAPSSTLEHQRPRTPDPNFVPHPRLGGPHWEGLFFP